MSTGVFVDGTTGETVVRDLTAEEADALHEGKQQRLERLQAECSANRHGAYVAEADPLFFKWQRGENTKVDWLAKVQEIRNRYPEPANG